MLTIKQKIKYYMTVRDLQNETNTIYMYMYISVLQPKKSDFEFPRVSETWKLQLKRFLKYPFQGNARKLLGVRFPRKRETF